MGDALKEVEPGGGSYKVSCGVGEEGRVAIGEDGEGGED